MITIRDIYAFLELVEQCNFNTAAEKLFLTQSGLSRKIKHIEDQVNQRLFERTTRFVRPTREGLLLAKHWSAAVAMYQDGLSAIAAKDDQLYGSLQIGVSGTSRYGEWQGVGEEFVNRYPKVNIRIESITTQDVIFHVKNGDLEAGFCGGGFVDPDSLGVIRIEQIPYRALLPSAHPLAKHKTIKLSDLKGMPLVLMNGATWPIVRGPLDLILKREGLLGQVVKEPHFADIQIRTIVNGEGIGIHPNAKTQLFPIGVTQVDISDLGLVLDNNFIWKKSTTSPIVRALVNLVKARHPG